MLLRVLAALPLLVLSAFGQDSDLPPDEAASLVQIYVRRGFESLRAGNYAEAKLRFSKALEKDGTNSKALLGTAEADRAVGAYDKARNEIAALLKAHPGDREGSVLLAKLDLAQGREAEARDLAKDVIARGGNEGPDLVGLDARLVLAQGLAVVGKRDDARTVLDYFLSDYKRRYDALAQSAFHSDELRYEPDKARPIADEMTKIAAALRMYVELSPLDYRYAQNALELVDFAKKLVPEFWPAWIEYVRITRFEREVAIAKAHKALQFAQDRNPELADLYVAAAKSIAVGFNEAEARSLAEDAIRVNPKETDARALLARVFLEDNMYSEAEQQIQAGLAVNPRHRDLLALAATEKLLTGDEAGFKAGMKKVLDVDPTYGEAYHLAAIVVAFRQRRYDRSVDLVRKGLEIDPENFDAQADLGVFLANLGREEEARKALAASQKLFPFSHPIRDNFLKVLDHTTQEMTEEDSKHFHFRMEPSEDRILLPYLRPLLESCWDDMVKRYGFTPKFPVLVEVFKKADDFSVRTLGMPGIPALGACFGGLITLDSPQALPVGSFLWASTARHEFAHVISLQLSQGQVPRWFTEGMSVLEEKPLDTGWSLQAGLERQVYDAYVTHSLPKVGTFDAMFRGPRVVFAYHVGGLMLEFLKERSGEAGIVKALKLYGEDKPMEDVFKEAFGLTLDQFDAHFRDFIGARVSRYHRIPDYAPVFDDLRKALLKRPDDGETLLKLAWGLYQQHAYVDAGAYLDRALHHLKKDTPDALLLQAQLAARAAQDTKAHDLFTRYFAAGGEDYDARMQMAAYAQQAGDEKAFVDNLLHAKEDWPLDVKGACPYELLRRYYASKGEKEKALAELEEQTRIDSTNLEKHLELAHEYLTRGRKDDALRILEQAMRITVADPRVHLALIPLYKEKGEYEKAIRSARCVVGLLPANASDEDAAKAWVRLAELDLQAGRVEEARTALAGAKQHAPDLPQVKSLEKEIEAAGKAKTDH